MEEAAKVIGGVTGELLFFARSFLLGFLLRLSYEPLILVRKLFRHPKLVVDVQDILFWTAGSFLMFGLLLRENNGTPRLFSLVGILAGMILYQLGPGRLTGALFNKLRRKSREWKRIYQEKRKDRIQKRKDRIQKHKDRIQKRKDRLQEQKVAARQQKKHRPEAKNEKKRLKKEQKDSMIKRQDEHSRNKRGEDSDRKNGSPQESQSQVDRTGTRDSDPRKRDDLDRRKQSGRAKRTEPGAAKAPRRADRKGRGAQRRT